MLKCNVFILYHIVGYVSFGLGLVVSFGFICLFSIWIIVFVILYCIL